MKGIGEEKKGDKAHDARHGYVLLREAVQYKSLYIRQAISEKDNPSQTINY